MISVYAKRNTDGTFTVSVVNHDRVLMPEGNLWEQDGWQRMNVEGISFYGWTSPEEKQDPVGYLQGGELIMFGCQTLRPIKRKDDGYEVSFV